MCHKAVRAELDCPDNLSIELINSTVRLLLEARNLFDLRLGRREKALPGAATAGSSA